jgi:hypothetical protein
MNPTAETLAVSNAKPPYAFVSGNPDPPNAGWNPKTFPNGSLFATDSPMAIGTAVEILLKMPQEITGRPTAEWRCTGHVVRLQPVDASRSQLGVGVQFDCCEILCPKTVSTL